MGAFFDAAMVVIGLVLLRRTYRDYLHGSVIYQSHWLAGVVEYDRFDAPVRYWVLIWGRVAVGFALMLYYVAQLAGWCRRKDEAPIPAEPPGGRLMPTSSALKEVMRELAALEDPRILAVNERHGDDHGVNLTKLRALAKSLKTQHDLALQLWATGDVAARLLATLVCKPKALSAADLDAMVRDIRAPKLLDWFIVNVVKPGPHAEELRLRWKDGDDLVGRAGWSLTTERVVKNAEGLDLKALLNQIEKEMKKAPERKQWAMNHCLAEIGIHHREHRARAIDIGERLAVLIDYPASPGCTPPYAPLWIAEMARRNEGSGSVAKRERA